MLRAALVAAGAGHRPSRDRVNQPATRNQFMGHTHKRESNVSRTYVRLCWTDDSQSFRIEKKHCYRGEGQADVKPNAVVQRKLL